MPSSSFISKFIFCAVAAAVAAPLAVSIASGFAEENISDINQSSSAPKAQNATQQDTDVSVQGSADIDTPETPVVSDIFINEVYFQGTSSPQVDWVELYSPSDISISLDGLAIQDMTCSGMTCPNQKVLAGTIGGADAVDKFVIVEFSNRLNASGDGVRLVRTSDDEIIDQIRYSDADTGEFDMGSVGTADTIARTTDAGPTLIKRRESGVTQGSSNVCASGGQVINQTSATAFCDIAGAVDDASSGDTLFIENGHYVPSDTITISTPLTITGQSESGVSLDMSGLDGYGVLVTADDVTIRNMTVEGTRGSDTSFTFKIGDAVPIISNIRLDTITIQNGQQTLFDIHGVDEFTAHNLTAIGSTDGNGMSLSGVDGATVTDFVGGQNAWVDVVVYGSSYTQPARISQDITIADTAELGSVFVQDEILDMSTADPSDTRTLIAQDITVGSRVPFSTSSHIAQSYVLITPLDIPIQGGYNSSDDIAAGSRPVQFACSQAVTNHNQMSVVWDWAGTNPYPIGLAVLPDAPVRFERQYAVDNGGWLGSEIYSDLNTTYRNFGSAEGDAGLYHSRVRAFVDIDDDNQRDADEFTSDWSNECSIEFDPFVYPISPQTRVVTTIVATDTDQNRLPGWSITATRPGEDISALVVTDSIGTTTQQSFPAGQYSITVSGTFQHRIGEYGVADAGYSLRTPTESFDAQYIHTLSGQRWLDQYRFISQDETPHGLAVRINDVCATPTVIDIEDCWNNNPASGVIYWGEYTDTHQYTINYYHDGGQMTFNMRDSTHADNASGSLAIGIAPVSVSGLTDSNGQFAFTAPQGYYAITETVQPGWQFIRRSDGQNNGEFLDASSDTTLTIVNQAIPANSTPTPVPANPSQSISPSPVLTQNTQDTPQNFNQELAEPDASLDDDRQGSDIITITPSPQGQVAGVQDQADMCTVSDDFPWWLVWIMVVHVAVLIIAIMFKRRSFRSS